MPYYEFIWTERALAKIELNGVTQNEVESVVSNPIRTGQSRTSGRPLAVGLADDGRLLICIYETIDELHVLPVTAFFAEPR
jgi:hypothetical protein